MKLLGLDIEIGNPFTLEDGFTPWPREEAWITEIACVKKTLAKIKESDV